MLNELPESNDEMEDGNLPPDIKPMTKEDILAVVKAEESNARTWGDELTVERETALNYYHGKPLGDEEEGRSQVVSNDVCDVVEWLMPEFMRVFGGDDDLVEFEATGTDVEGATLATKYVNHVINVDNDGFTLKHDTVKDGLLTKFGCFKWQWVEKVEPIDRDYMGMSEMEMAALMQDLQDKAGDTEVKVLAQAVEEGPAGPVYSLRIRMMRKWGQVEVCAVPPEELLIPRAAVAINQSTRYVAHRTTKTRSDLVAMGYPIHEVMELSPYEDDMWTNGVSSARFDGSGSVFGVDVPVQNKMAQPVEYIEHYCLMDADGDGISERMLVCTSGNEVLRAEAVSGLPFAGWSPVRMSHSAIGRSVADLVIDIQRMRTALLRGTMDNIYSINAGGRKEVVIGQVNMDDLLTPRPNGIVRVKQPGQIRDMTTEFIGAQTMAILNMTREMRDERTGQMRHQQGLTAESLHQSTDAAMSMIESMQARTELMCRLYAEALKQMYAGVLDLIVRHQDKPRQVRIGGKVLNIDPSAFKERYGLRVKVGSGNASKERKRADLEYIFAKQGQAVQVGMSSNQHIYNTLTDMVALTTQRDVSRYFVDPSMIAPKQDAPPEDPLVMAEKVKLQGDMMRAAQKDKFDREARDVDHTEKMTDLSLKYSVPLPGSVFAP